MWNSLSAKKPIIAATALLLISCGNGTRKGADIVDDTLSIDSMSTEQPVVVKKKPKHFEFNVFDVHVGQKANLVLEVLKSQGFVGEKEIDGYLDYNKRIKLNGVTLKEEHLCAVSNKITYIRLTSEDLSESQTYTTFDKLVDFYKKEFKQYTFIITEEEEDDGYKEYIEGEGSPIFFPKACSFTDECGHFLSVSVGVQFRDRTMTKYEPRLRNTHWYVQIELGRDSTYDDSYDCEEESDDSAEDDPVIDDYECKTTGDRLFLYSTQTGVYTSAEGGVHKFTWYRKGDKIIITYSGLGSDCLTYNPNRHTLKLETELFGTMIFE